MMSTLDHIPSFHAVMTHGSLSAAARVLNLAQPTVRRHIEVMETELRTALFTRAANGLTPTAMAHSLLPMAEAVLEQAHALTRAACAERTALGGIVRITCSRVVATHVLPPLLVQLRTQAPDITFEIAATDTAENLAQRAADIAIRFTVPHQHALVALRLPDVGVGLFVAPSFEVPQSASITDLPFISDDRADQLLPALTAAGMGIPHNIALRCDDPLAQLAHLQAGVGVGVCQIKLAARLGLRRVMPDLHHAMPAWLVVHEDQSRIPRMRHVFDHLKAHLPDVM